VSEWPQLLISDPELHIVYGDPVLLQLMISNNF